MTPELTPSRRAENVRLWNQLQDMDPKLKSFRELSVTLAHDLPLYEARIVELEAVLAESEQKRAELTAKYNHLLFRVGATP